MNESSTTVGSPGEALSKRCVLLLKTALKPGFWQGEAFGIVDVFLQATNMYKICFTPEHTFEITCLLDLGIV